MNQDRYFYHSFPRRPGSDAYIRGLAILRGILERGLLLAPEIITFRESLQGGVPSGEIHVSQKRACFTELTPAELPDHAKQFGPFALEFEIDSLRQLGAIPTFYTPMPIHPVGLEGVGVAMLARIGEIQTLLDRLVKLDEEYRKTSDSDLLKITRQGAASLSRITGGAAEDVIGYLTHGIQSASVLSGALKWMSGLIYPVENLRYTEPLGYYRQREWRLLANAVHEGVDVTGAAAEADIAALMAMDKEFFGRVLEFPTGKYTIAHQSQFLRTFRGKPFASYARRIVAPAKAVSNVAEALAQKGVSIEVVALETLDRCLLHRRFPKWLCRPPRSRDA